MRTIIAGSRTILNYKHILAAVVESGFHISQVVSGTTNGVETLHQKIGIQYAI
jgi:hypothetical protein